MTFLHAIWALLNLVLIVGAYVISYVNFRSFSKRFGCLPSALLILAIVVTCSGSRNKAIDESMGLSQIKNIYPADTWLFKDRHVVVYGDKLFRITQSVTIYPVLNTDSLRIQSTITAGGLTLGTRWEPAQTVAGLLPGRQAFYQSTGTLTWYLLSVPVYSQWKHFNGEIPLDKS